MFLLDVQEDRVLGLEERHRAVALVAFRDEILSLVVPVGVRSQDGDLGADVVAWSQTARA